MSDPRTKGGPPASATATYTGDEAHPRAQQLHFAIPVPSHHPNAVRSCGYFVAEAHRMGAPVPQHTTDREVFDRAGLARCPECVTLAQPLAVEKRLPPASIVDGAVALLRETFRNDGAEGESAHLVCDALEAARREANIAAAERDAAKMEAATLTARVAAWEAFYRARDAYHNRSRHEQWEAYFAAGKALLAAGGNLDGIDDADLFGEKGGSRG